MTQRVLEFFYIIYEPKMKVKCTLLLVLEYFLLFLIVGMLAFIIECYWPKIMDIHNKVSYIYENFEK